MSMWVTRRNLDGSVVFAPMLSVDVDATTAQPGHRTFSECLSILVADGEKCTGQGTRRTIEKSGHLVGYLTLTMNPH